MTTTRCEHTKVTHEHGTRTCYVADHCRCKPCTAANRRYESERTRARIYGRQRRLVDAQPIRLHVIELRRAGMGTRQIATVAKVGRSTITYLLFGRPRGDGTYRPPTGRLDIAVAERILAVTAPQVATGTPIDGTGTRRRLQALVAIGWSINRIADRIGWTGTNLASLISGQRQVLARTAALVEQIYDELWNQPQHGADHFSRIAAARARNLAAARRWAPPMAWDDDSIDDPAAKPELGADWRTSNSQLVDLDGILDLLEVSPTIRLDDAAVRLGVSSPTIEKALHRAGRNDLAVRMRRSQDHELTRRSA